METLSDMPQVTLDLEVTELDLKTPLIDFEVIHFSLFQIASLIHLLKAWISKR